MSGVRLFQNRPLSRPKVLLLGEFALNTIVANKRTRTQDAFIEQFPSCSAFQEILQPNRRPRDWVNSDRVMVPKRRRTREVRYEVMSTKRGDRDDLACMDRNAGRVFLRTEL